MIVRVRAGWVVPVVSPPLRHGWLDVDAVRGEIVEVGSGGTVSGDPHRTVDLGEVAVLPGLVNAHTHLELSHLAGQVEPASTFVAWVRTMLQVRRAHAADGTAIAEALRRAIAAMEASGTAAVGDIGNTDAAVLPLAASSLHGLHFREALGFRAADAGRLAAAALGEARLSHEALQGSTVTRLRVSVAPHAPYSTSAALVQALAAGLPRGEARSSMHVGESPEEVEFLARGTGALRDLLVDLGVMDDAWQPPGLRPVEYLHHLGVLHRGLLIVHGTHCTARELWQVRDAGAAVVLCARSNRRVGAGDPPVSRVFASGVRVAVGTDSLTSVDDLNMFAELARLRALAPDVPAAALLYAATAGGAHALGCTGLGRLTRGASARALVRVPPAGTVDVEEWLVSGATDTDDVRWMDIPDLHGVR